MMSATHSKMAEPIDRITADREAYVAWVQARVLRTSGDVGRAAVAADEARYAADHGDTSFVQFCRLLDANMSTAVIVERVVGQGDLDTMTR
jgi:hypothetical protein